MTFGERLKEARKKKGLTQRELAKLIGAKNNSISNWEKDQNVPNGSTVLALSKVLDVSIENLIGHYNLNDVEEIGNKPASERTKIEALAYDFFTSQISGLGEQLQTAVLEKKASLEREKLIREGEALKTEFEGLITAYEQLDDEGKSYVEQSVKMALADYFRRKGDK